MCYIQTLRGITGNSDTTNTNSPWGTMPWPCPRRSVVKQSGQVSRSRRSKQNVRWRDELRHQPGPGGPISQPGKWDQHPKARKTGSTPLCLSLDTIQVSVETTRHVADKSWHGEDGEPEKGNRVTRHVMRHPCIKTHPGDPR